MSSVAERVKEIRTKNSVSQSEMADKMGLSLRTYQRFEQNPDDLERIHQFASYFDVSPEWLLTGYNIDRLKNENIELYEIPILSTRAAAGAAGNVLSAIDEFDTSKKLQVDKVLFKTPPKGTIRAVQVDGDSMVPRLYPDSWVLFDETSEWVGDGLYVINFQNILMVKLLQMNLATGNLHIKSINPSYESWEIEAANQEYFRIIGKVLRSII